MKINQAGVNAPAYFSIQMTDKQYVEIRAKLAARYLERYPGLSHQVGDLTLKGAHTESIKKWAMGLKIEGVTSLGISCLIEVFSTKHT